MAGKFVPLRAHYVTVSVLVSTVLVSTTKPPTQASQMEAFEAATLSHSNEEWEEAADQYSLALRELKGSSLAICHDRRGCCLAELPGKLNAAVLSHTKAIELAPNMFTAYHNRGHAQMHQGNLREAKADLEQALQLEHSAESARMLSHATMEIECPHLAKAAFARALEAYGLGEWGYASQMFQ